jgi:TMEM175 potassium channel family protein
MSMSSSINRNLIEPGRLVALIDGVFAVALTLLVLDLKLPPGTIQLLPALKQMLPGFLVYLLVFASVAGYWTIHHASFRSIVYVDGRLIVLSLINLLFVTLFPVSASIVGAHPLEPLATVCLSLNSMFYCISAWAIWSHASANRELLARNADPIRIQEVARIMLVVAIGLMVAIPLAYITIYLAYMIWIFYAPVTAWWIRSKHLKKEQKGKD